jgi:hypothetical protein
MSSYVSRAALGGGILVLAGTLTVQAQTPNSARTNSAVDQLGLDDPAPAVFSRPRELRCRGKEGIDLRVEQDPSPRQPKLVAMVLHYERPKVTTSLSYEGMGTVDNGMSVQNLPGTCTWNPTLSKEVPPEPMVVYFDLPRDAQAWAAPGSRDTTIEAAVSYPDVASMTRYLNDPGRFWIFYVDDVTSLSISYRAAGLVPPGFDGPGTVSTDHSLTTSRDGRTSDAGTAASTSPADGAAGPVQDATPDRPTTRPTTISVTPPPDSTVSPPPPGDEASPETTEARDAGASKEARAKRQAGLASGIRDVSAAPGPRGVKLSFHTARGARVRVQFGKEPPRWNAREGRWEYRGGAGSLWFGSTERAVGETGYVATPVSTLNPGARYHYLITVLADKDSPERQRTGSFTARVDR